MISQCHHGMGVPLTSISSTDDKPCRQLCKTRHFFVDKIAQVWSYKVRQGNSSGGSILDDGNLVDIFTNHNNGTQYWSHAAVLICIYIA